MEKMPVEIEGFSHTEYLMVFNAIIFGYVGAEYFIGWGSILRNRDGIRSYWQHIVWTIFAFTLFIQNWWGVWPRARVINDSLYYFMFSLAPIFLFHLISVILFPDFHKIEKVNMKEYFYKNTRWLFSLFAVYFVITIINSFVYEDIGNVVWQNIIRGLAILLSLAAAYFNKSEILHVIFLIIGYVSLIRFFVALPT